MTTTRPTPPHAHQCKECGATLPDAARPEGLCAKCLLKIGMQAPAPPPGAPTAAEIEKWIPGIRVDAVIGEGGMGIVYKGLQTRLDRPVAIKLLTPALGRDPEFVERFTREARALARLNHNNIVNVYDFGETGGTCYLVMELVDGMSLRQLLTLQKLSPAQALAIVPQICDALQYAHEAGIVHRDIKPENILIDTRGRVKVADFGLAKLLNSGPADNFTLTGSQQILGTVNYMAPEQREHPMDVDHRADIYALGVVLYEMLTGELPLGRFAPPSKKVTIDVRLDEVVLRALEKDPGLRYQKASEFKTNIQNASAAAPAPAPPAPAPPPAPAANIKNPPAPQPPSPAPDHARTVKSIVTGIGVCAGVLIGSGFLNWASFTMEAFQIVSPDTRIYANGYRAHVNIGNLIKIDMSLVIFVALIAMALSVWRALGDFRVRFVIPIFYIFSLAITAVMIPIAFSSNNGRPEPGVFIAFSAILGGYISYYHIVNLQKPAAAGNPDKL